MHWSSRLLLWHATIVVGRFAVGLLLGPFKVTSGHALLEVIFAPHGILFAVAGFLMYLLIPTFVVWFFIRVVRWVSPDLKKTRSNLAHP